MSKEIIETGEVNLPVNKGEFSTKMVKNIVLSQLPEELKEHQNIVRSATTLASDLFSKVNQAGGWKGVSNKNEIIASAYNLISTGIDLTQQGTYYIIKYGTGFNIHIGYLAKKQIAIATNSLGITDIKTIIIREKDEVNFTYSNVGEIKSVEFKKRDDFKESKPKLVLVFGVNDEGEVIKTESYNYEQRLKLSQSFSQAAGSKAWKNSPEDMVIRSCLNHYAKMLPKSYNTTSQIIAMNSQNAIDGNDVDEETIMDFTTSKTKERIVVDDAPTTEEPSKTAAF